MLAFAPSLEGLGRIAVQRHERLDGSGYPVGLTGEQIGTTARMLAAADVYQALCEPRPHRPAGVAQDAARELRERSPPDDSTASRWTAGFVPRGTGSVADASGQRA